MCAGLRMLAPWVVLHAELSACHELVTGVLKHLSPGSFALFLRLGTASLRIPQTANILGRFFAVGLAVLVLLVRFSQLRAFRPKM